MANKKFRSDRERDPIAELAQLIAEADPYGERAAPDNRFRQETASDDEALGLPPAPQLPADVRAPEQAYEIDEYRHDDQAYDAENPPYSSHEEYQTEVPRVRRRSLALMNRRGRRDNRAPEHLAVPECAGRAQQRKTGHRYHWI